MVTYLAMNGQIGVSLQQLEVGSLESEVTSPSPVTLAQTKSSALLTVICSSNSQFSQRQPESTLMTQYRMPDYQPRHYGFFCKVESKIERKSNLAPRFRLGSPDYVDGLEGKYVPVIR